jgi:DNA processing protein
MTAAASDAHRSPSVLLSRCERIAAEGTDPSALAALLTWSVRPRRNLDVLRRVCRDAGTTAGADADEAGRDRLPVHRLLSAMSGLAAPGSAEDERAAATIAGTWVDGGIRVAIVGDPAYPRRLAEGWPHTDGPAFLAWRGTPVDDAPAVAIVGSRRASGYGVGIASWLAEAASRAGARIVSGGAVGIDAAAHAAALEEPGGTTVVLGCGHAVPYPRVHARPGGLFERVVDHGGTVLGELLPHEPPRAWQVRARNRIVAALADVVVVVEGSARSGALLTAGAAAERGRPVLAVPGDVRSAGSVAPHRLLAEGADPCTGPADLLAALPTLRGHRGGPGPQDPLPTVRTTLPPAVHAALAAAWPRPLRIDDLAARSGHPVASLLAALTRARVAGELAEGVDGVRLRRSP